MREQESVAVKVLVTVSSRIPKVIAMLMEFFIKHERASLHRHPLLNFCQEKSVLEAHECLEKVHTQINTYQDPRNMIKCLLRLHSFCLKVEPKTTGGFGKMMSKHTIIVGELATPFEKISEVHINEWMPVRDAAVIQTEETQHYLWLQLQARAILTPPHLALFEPGTYSPACRLCDSSISNCEHIFYSCSAHLPPAFWHLRSSKQREAPLSSIRPDLQLRVLTWAEDVPARHCLDATTGSLKATHNAAV
ncbi:hypothetical protein MRX96_012389 [Rhipicephalus microplus]